MMESLLLFIIDHPGADLDYLYEHYKCVLQPVAIDDCIELFQEMNCLETVRISLKRTSIDLYAHEQLDDDDNDDDNDTNHEEKVEQIPYDTENDLERLLMKTNYDYRQATLYCFPTYDCLTKFGLAFPSSLVHQERTMDRMPFPSY
jgi:hypothetical protein